MDKERISELKSMIYSNKKLEYIVKNEDITKEELLDILADRNIKIPARISKERAVMLILNDGGLDELKEKYLKTYKVPFWDVMDCYKINKEQLNLLLDMEYFKNVTMEEFRYYHNGVKDYRTGTRFSPNILYYDKKEIKDFLKSITPKGFRIRVETGSNEDLDLIEKNLRKLFDFDFFEVYEKRGSGYMNYATITPKFLENKNFENRLKLENTRLKEELKELKSINRALNREKEFSESAIKNFAENITRVKMDLNKYKDDIDLEAMARYIIGNIPYTSQGIEAMEILIEGSLQMRYIDIYKKLYKDKND